MKNPVYIFILLLSVLMFPSCDPTRTETADWGKTKSYSDFLWNSYTPIKMEQTLELEFNDDAKKFLTGDIVFELVAKNEDGRFSPIGDVLCIYKNGELCENNRMSIGKDDSEVVVGIEFKRNAPEGCYTLFLNPVETAGLDRIELIDLRNGFNVQKIDIMNPLAQRVIWSVAAIIILFVVWTVVARMINPPLKFSRITFDYQDGTGELSHRVGNCYKIVCTNKAKRIPLLQKIFIGNVYVEVNEYWSSELTIVCGLRDRIRLLTRGDYLLPDEPVRKEAFSIRNDRQQTVTIETT